MATVSLREQIISQIDRLSPEQQRQLLDFATSLAQPPGEPGDAIIRAAREMGFSREDLAEMQRAIDEDCENINPDAW